MKPRDGGPAFPIHGSMGEVSHEGMSLRDFFAAKAMIRFIASDRGSKHNEMIAEYSYALADALLNERDKSGREG